MEDRQFLITHKGEVTTCHSKELFIAEVQSIAAEKHDKEGIRTVQDAMGFIDSSEAEIKLEVKKVGLELTIKLKGLTESDIEMALAETQRLITKGDEWGLNSNETGSFDFELDGEVLELPEELDADELSEIVVPYLPVTKPIDINHYDGDQYYLLELVPSDDGGDVEVSVFEPHRYHSGEREPIQEVTIENILPYSPR